MEWIKIIFLIGMLKIFLLGMATGQKNVITLNDGGYSNVLIAIDRKVPEDLTIIENIKTMFTSASQRLYNASRNHVYWKHIKILVPNTWSNLSRFEHSRTESLHSANIIVHHFPDDEPYVENLEGCGKGALSLMHLTPEYILNEQYREDEFGDTDNVLVRSWGYYRWGLFKENYDGKGVSNASYESGSKNDDPNSTGQSREGTRCSLEIKGNLSPSSCTTKQKKDCLFIPDTESEQTAKTSLLFATRKYHVPSISEFCDDGSHNIKAPNLMNNHCCGKSAWKVMTEHTTDFQHVHGEVERHSDITPVFEVLALSSVRSVVLVLDVSSSMLGCKLKRMIQSCKTYISTIPKGSKLGIVTFSEEAEIRANLTDVTDITSREGLMNDLPTNADWDTCIACGILSAIEVLGPYAQGGSIVLLSDGIEIIPSPVIKDILHNITEAGVIIDTIAISNYADQQMEDLSTNTYGTSGFCPDRCDTDNESGNCLTPQFLSTITDRPDVGTGATPVLILNSEITIKSDSGFHVFPVVIDDALGNNTVITVEWTESNSILVEVAGPDGTQIDHNDPRYYTGDKIVTIAIPQAQAGLWHIRVSGITHVEHASVSVTSEQSTKYSPVTVKVLLGSHNVNYSSKPALAIYVKVEQDYLPVLNATVTAIVSSESSSKTLSLVDNGTGCDVMKDDGAYSGCFTDFQDNGRHDVKVNVTGYIAVEGGSWRERRSAESSDSVPAAAQSFMRTASGGVFKVEGYRPYAPDILPPSRIRDLVYTSFSYDNSTVTLSWTAVGDDLDQGTASRYELRYSTKFFDLRNNFGSCHEVTQDQLVNGNLANINPSGVTETITVTLPERGQEIVYNFAIRAWDEAGNGGDLSNFASLSIRFIPEPIEPTTQYQSSTNPTTLGESSTSPTMAGQSSTNLTTPDESYSKPTNELEFHPDKKYIGIWCAVAAGILAGICIPIVSVWISYRRKYPVKFKTEDGIQGGGVEKLNPTYSNPTFTPI